MFPSITWQHHKPTGRREPYMQGAHVPEKMSPSLVPPLHTWTVTLPPVSQYLPTILLEIPWSWFYFDGTFCEKMGRNAVGMSGRLIFFMSWNSRKAELTGRAKVCPPRYFYISSISIIFTILSQTLVLLSRKWHILQTKFFTLLIPENYALNKWSQAVWEQYLSSILVEQCLILSSPSLVLTLVLTSLSSAADSNHP